MKYRSWSPLFACAGLLVSGCGDKTYSPPACDAMAAPKGAADVPAGVVWGFADLHAHPAIEVAFDGRLIWGTALDDAPVNAAELPRIAACPIETHETKVSSPLDRVAGNIIFSFLASNEAFAHAPVGKESGTALIDAWPNARDVIHQQMNVASIRRAYEGGLRLMFASTTDDQVLRALLTGPNLVDGFVPNPDADYDSARLQLDLIVRMVKANDKWMAIVRTPKEAREAIGAGKLALVLSLEMNGLRKKDVDKLVADYGVSSMIPIHLIDNDVGGTATAGDLFNASSAEVSALYRDHEPYEYIEVSASSRYHKALGRPPTLVTFDVAPIYLNVAPVPYQTYKDLCYEPLEACSGPAVTSASYFEYGQKNSLGLFANDTPERGAGFLKYLVDGRTMIVDIAHMSEASAAGAFDIVDRKVADEGAAYTLIDSHSDVAHLCEGSADPDCVDESREPTSERDLESTRARALLRAGGVLGYGTSLGKYVTKSLVVARGGPLWTLDANGSNSVCAVKGDAAGGECQSALTVDQVSPEIPMTTLVVRTKGGVTTSGTVGGAAPSPATPVARIELLGPDPAQRYQRRVIVVPLQCNTSACEGQVEVPGDRGVLVEPDPSGEACAARTCDVPGCGQSPYLVDDLESVTLEWLYGACDYDCQKEWGESAANQRCETTWDDDRAPAWTVEEATLTLTAQGTTDVTLAKLGSQGDAPVAQLKKSRGTLPLYRREDRPSAADGVPISGHLLKVTATAAPDSADLVGASPASTGANVCVAIRARVGDTCPPVAPPAKDATECPEGWSRLNQRGTWTHGLTLSSFVRFPGEESAVCGVDLAVLDWHATGVDGKDRFSIEEVRVEAMEDPIGHWVRRYAALARDVGDSQLGAIAVGTDMNGLNGTTDISECPVPEDATAASFCGAGESPEHRAPLPPLPLAPMRLRGADGTLGGRVLLEERGLGTYGLLADMMQVVKRYPGCGEDVYTSMMLSAERTIRAWEVIESGKAPDTLPPLGTRPFACEMPTACPAPAEAP
ncbi:MAG: hypothetical protein U0441_07920 [Polyangiaceae bacterium]